MSLNLNYYAEKQVKFKVYRGENIAQMAELVNDGRVPMSSRAVMRRRLEVLSRKAKTSQEERANAEVRDYWMYNYVDTGDDVFYHPEGGLKIVLDDPIMRELKADSPLIVGGLRLGKTRAESIARYNAIDSPELRRENLGILGRVLTLAQAKEHPVWKILSSENQSLLNDYMDALFEFHKISEGAGVYLDSPREVAHGRLWGFGSEYNNSSATGNIIINSKYGRLVGVVPEAREGNAP